MRLVAVVAIGSLCAGALLEEGPKNEEDAKRKTFSIGLFVLFHGRCAVLQFGA